tara:strand:- start:281 stop:901 length:621 start_codon:yes stop_codon:yes gene_type:complete
MIGRLKGTLLEKQPPLLLLDVNGVGYEVQAPMTTFYKLPMLGETATLHIHFSVSENAQQLFGFCDKQERELFRTLIKVSGVGPKMAVAILSGMETESFVRCVMEDNVSALVKVPGVGKKTAERLIIELRDKLKNWQLQSQPLTEMEAATPQAHNVANILEEAESALISLGYKPAEASRVVAKALKANEVDSSEELIRVSLRSMLPA